MDAKELVIVVDFGGQYNQLIARRVRENHVYCEVYPYHKAVAKIKELQPQGIIFTGGPGSVYEDNAPKIEEEVFHLGIPVLGLCYGMQFMAQTLGGEVKHADTPGLQKTRKSMSIQLRLCSKACKERNRLDEPSGLRRFHPGRL